MEARVLDALGNSVRRDILVLLSDGPRSVGEIAAELPVSRPAVSRHLRVLRDCGLVRSETVAQHRVYHAEAAPLREIDDWVSRYRAFWMEKLDALDTHLQEES